MDGAQIGSALVATVAEAVTRLGSPTAPGDIAFMWRGWRWVALLPGHVVFAGVDAQSWSRLEVEAAALSRFRTTAGSVVPPTLLRDGHYRIQIRERITGLTGHDVERLIFDTYDPPVSTIRYGEKCPLSRKGERLARDLGRALGHLHAAMSVQEAMELGICAIAAPINQRIVEETVHTHVGCETLPHALRRARAWAAALPPDPVVCHGDPHMHNVVVDNRNGGVRGIIDFDELCIAHRCHDLRYLHSNGLGFARRALQAYMAATGVKVDEQTVARYHVISALDHFAFVPPDAPRFPEIVGWATSAVRALAPEWAS